MKMYRLPSAQQVWGGSCRLEALSRAKRMAADKGITYCFHLIQISDVLIDELMPVYDFIERHQTRVRASPARTYAAIENADFSANPVVLFLLAIRALPARILGSRSAQTLARPLTLRNSERFGFFIAAENPPAEIVIALQGKFWTVRGGTECATRAALDLPIAPGVARAVWNFTVAPADDGRSVVATETRVLCADAHARRRFRIYWFFVRPGSGIIRRMMLRTIRKLAEAS
jgi:hypothetical protein